MRELEEERGLLARATGPGHFPHQLAWLIDNPVRRLLITPSRLAKRLPLTESSVVLEVGPGSGYFSRELARLVPRGRLELLDLQPQMLVKARRKLLAAGLQNVGFIAQDASRGLPFRDRHFDVAVLVAALGEIPNRESCLLELRRVLRPDGLLAIHEHAPDPDRIPKGVLYPLADACGFRVGKCWGPGWNYTATFVRPAGLASSRARG